MNDLEKLVGANKALAEVRCAKDAKSLVDLASAAEHYARKAKLGEEAIGHAHAIKIKAKDLLGGFLSKMEKNVGAKGIGTSAVPKGDRTPPTIAQVLCDDPDDEQQRRQAKKLSAEAQALNALPAAEKEAIASRQKTETQVKREQVKAAAIERIAVMPSGTFRVVYADPPWKYGDTLGGDLSENYGAAEKHYPPMTISELCALPIKDICDSDAVLFLWVTSPLLFECEPVFKAWGFAYKTSFIWDKVKHNMGHYNSVRHELLLVCTRGSCTPDVAKLFDSVQSIERTPKHSEKPEEFRTIIDTIYPHGRRLELFARAEAPGWERFSNEL